MSFVTVAPGMLGQAAADCQRLGSTLSEAKAAAAAHTIGIVAPAADEVSAAITALYGAHAQEFHALSAQAATFHSQFVNLLNAGAGSYVSTEIANVRAAAALGGGPVGIVQSVGSGILGQLVNTIPGVQQAQLVLNAVGPAVVALPALEQTGFVNALQTGDLGTAVAALSSPAVHQAVLYGQETVSLQVPLLTSSTSLVQSAVVNIPFGGLLAPLQPITLTVTVAGPGGPATFTLPIPGTQVGGFVPGVLASGPGLLLTLLGAL